MPNGGSPLPSAGEWDTARFIDDTTVTSSVYMLFSVTLGSYLMFFSGNFTSRTRMLSGFFVFGLAGFYANYVSGLVPYLTKSEMTQDPVAATFAFGLIGAGLMIYSYRLAMISTHVLAAYDLFVMTSLAQSVLDPKGYDSDKTHDFHSVTFWVACTYAGIGIVCALLPSWQKLIRPTVMVSGAISGSFTCVGGALYGVNRVLIWFPQDSLQPYSYSSSQVFNTGDICEGQYCLAFVVSYAIFVILSILVQTVVTCEPVGGYCFAVARYRLNAGLIPRVPNEVLEQLDSEYDPFDQVSIASDDAGRLQFEAGDVSPSAHVSLVDEGKRGSRDSTQSNEHAKDPYADQYEGQDFFTFKPIQDPMGAKIYIYSVLILVVFLVASVAFSIDWVESRFICAITFFLLNVFLIWGVTDFFVGSIGFHVLRLIWDFPPLASADYSEGLPGYMRTCIVYCLLANTVESCDDTFLNAVDCYLMNLDPSLNISCAVVSVSSIFDVVNREYELLGEWRQKIREILKEEVEEVVSTHKKRLEFRRQQEAIREEQKAKGETIDGQPRAARASLLLKVQEERREFWEVVSWNGGVVDASSEALRKRLLAIPEKVASNFFWIHRGCKVLKKPGQYFDFAALLYRGSEVGLSYTDPRYGVAGRQKGKRCFTMLENVKYEDRDKARVQLMNAEMQRDVKRLATLGRHKKTRFRFSMVMDKDTKSEPGAVIRLVEIAAKNTAFGIFMPALRIDDSGLDTTWFMFMESLRQVSSSNLPLAMFALFGRYGFYGKGLMNNELMLRRCVGDVDAQYMAEALPVDILSHDTYEAQLLRPCFVKEVCLKEEPAFNQISALVQSTRWMLGEVRNVSYQPGLYRSLTRVLCELYHCIFYRKRYQPPFIRYESMPASPGTRYLSLMTFRIMHAGPVIMVVIVLRNIFAPTGVLVFTDSFLGMYAGLFTIIGLFVVPKGMMITEVLPSLRRDWPKDPSQKPSEERFEQAAKEPVADYLPAKRLGLAVVEVLVSVMIFGPECIMGCVRMCKAYHAHISGKVTWTPQDQVDREVKENMGWRLIFNYTWYVSLAGLCVFWWDMHHRIFDIFSTSLWISWLLHPLVTWLNCQVVSETQKEWWLFRWVQELKQAQRVSGTQKDSSRAINAFMMTT